MKMSCAISCEGVAQALLIRNLVVEASSLRAGHLLMSLQKAVEILSQFWTDAFRRRDLFHGGFPKAIDGAESTQKQVLTALTYARAIIENAFADALLHQELVVGVGE